MSNTPPELHYTASHEWLRLEENGEYSIGISDHAQNALGDVVYLELPAVGDSLQAGQACAVIESVKAASDIYAPLAGEVTAINQAAVDDPAQINADAYAAWLFRLRPEAAPAADAFLDAAAYAAQTADS